MRIRTVCFVHSTQSGDCVGHTSCRRRRLPCLTRGVAVWLAVLAVLMSPLESSVTFQSSARAEDAGRAEDTGRAEDSVVAETARYLTTAAQKSGSKVTVPLTAFDGGTEWLNTSRPLSLADLRGKVVLVDFWTYCCINCMHILPDLAWLEEKYADQLVVIGVHSAKFANEKSSQSIRDAIRRYEIRHPVLNDSELIVWRNFGVSGWPTLVLIDPEGKFVAARSGEGHRDFMDTAIQKLVNTHRRRGTLDEHPIVFGSDAGEVQPAPLKYPGKVCADARTGRLFITDSNHNRIIVTRLNGELLDVIGSGQSGTADGSFENAEFNRPQGVTLVDQTLYVADTENHLLRTVDLQNRSVSRLAGTGEQADVGRSTGGRLGSTALNSPWSVVHVNGTLFIAMAGPHQIWWHKVGSDRISRFAGSGSENVTNGNLTDAAFAQPSELTADDKGRFLYVVDSEGSAVRRVPTSSPGLVSTVAGSSELPLAQSLFAFGDIDARGSFARFQHPLGVVFVENRLYVADSYNHKIRVVDLKTSDVTTLAGNGQAGNSLEPLQLSEPGGISAAEGRLYVADTNNHRIVLIDLASLEASELKIDGLTPPQPRRSTTPPLEPDAVALGPQTISAGNELPVTVNLAVPDGYKLNELAPVTWEVFAEKNQTVIAENVLGLRDEAVVTEGRAEFRLPLTGQRGETTLLIRMNYGFCADNSSLCRLASAAWRIPVRVTGKSGIEELSLEFPAVTVSPATQK